MSLTTDMAEFVFLLLVLWRTVWSRCGAVSDLMAIGVPAIMRWVAFSSRRTVLIIAILAFGWWWRPTWGASPLAVLVLATILILVLVILEDWFLTFCPELYDSLTDLFYVGDDLVIHPVDHIVLEVSLKANLAPLSERLGALKPLCPLLDGATKLF